MTGLRLERPCDGVALVTIDRAGTRNALDDALLLDGLPGTIESLGEDPHVRAVVLTGAAGAFSSGADLGCSGLEQASPVDSLEYMQRSHSTVIRIRALRQPVIAAVDGPAVGAGLGLAAACDIRIASSRAKFVAPFVKMGLPPDFGTTYLLPRLVGADAAMEMFLSCRTIEGGEALRMGLVTQLSEDPLATALDLAAVVASHPWFAVAHTKRNIYSGLDADMRTAVEDGEIRSVAAALHSDGFRERFAQWKHEITGS